jgi:hypothetical protein
LLLRLKRGTESQEEEPRFSFKNDLLFPKSFHYPKKILLRNIPYIFKLLKKMNENDVSYLIRGCIFSVYNALGPGLLESAYQAVLLHVLREEGLEVQSEVFLPVIYN